MLSDGQEIELHHDGLLEHGLRDEQAQRMLLGGSRMVHQPGLVYQNPALKQDPNPALKQD